MPCNKVDQWVELLDFVGCHAFTPKGFMVRRDSRYLMVFSGKDGTIPPESIVMTGQMAQTGRAEIVLERRYSKVCDVMTGETVAEDTDRFELSSDKPKVWCLETESNVSRRNREKARSRVPWGSGDGKAGESLKFK